MDRLEQSEANKSLGARVVFLHGLPKDVVEAIISYTPNDFETTLMTSDHSLKEQTEIVSEADFLMVYRAELSDEVLRAASKCRLVQLLAAGYDSMNLGLMKYLGIPCANNGGANSWAVADHAVLLMLALYKKLVLADSATRGGNWNKPIDGQNTFELADKLVGVIGMGNIGRQVAKRVQAFDAIVQYYDAYPLSRMTEQELTVSRVSLKELLTAASIGISAFLSSIKSPKELSSSSPTGVSRLIGSFAIFKTFFTLSKGICNLSANSLGVGSLPISDII